MEIRVYPDADSVAKEAARLIAAEARASVASRGSFHLAVSGGRTPWQMLRALSTEEMPWQQTHIFQVDERIAPEGHKDRNLTLMLESISNTSIPAAQIHPMPVESADLQSAAAQYAATLQKIAGTPPVLDLVHLGLGPDGHTASLIPGDPVLDVLDSDVALTGIYQERRRMTFTFPMINRARRILWIVTGAEKSAMLARLLKLDTSIPAGRIQQDNALALADRLASI